MPITLATEALLLTKLGALPLTYSAELANQWIDYRNQQLELSTLLTTERKQKVELLNDLAILDSLADPVKFSHVQFTSLLPLLDAACQSHDVVLASCLIRVLSSRSGMQPLAVRIFTEALAFLCDQQRLNYTFDKQPMTEEDASDAVMHTVQVLWAVLTYIMESRSASP